MIALVGRCGLERLPGGLCSARSDEFLLGGLSDERQRGGLRDDRSGER